MKRHARTVVGIALAVILLLLAFRGIDFRDLLRTIAGGRYRWLVPAMVFVFASMIFRAFRWGCLIAPMKRIGFLDLLSAISICFMANNVLPARSGEFIRALLIGRRHGLAFSAVFATVVLERISDALCLMAIFLSLLLSLTVERDLRNLGLVLVAVYLSLLAALVAARFRPAAVRRAVGRLVSPLPSRFGGRVAGAAGSFIDGLRVLTSVRQVALVVAHSVCVWACILFTYYFINRAFDIRGIGLPGYALLLTMLAVAVMVPSPGYIGSFQLAYREALRRLRQPDDLALAGGWVAWGAQYIFINLLGAIFLWREGVSFGRLRREEEEVEREIGGRRDDPAARGGG
ncbi:MAG: lysylphosphatidylglycerol synthase transmembrane domain-containing protein [bacterium]|nr:lysylphosphatidylglycerol synthase transmembrane domain-containing protein [bacterium]